MFTKVNCCPFFQYLLQRLAVRSKRVRTLRWPSSSEKCSKDKYINILGAAFLAKVFRIKNTNTNCVNKKAASNTVVQISCSYNVGAIDTCQYFKYDLRMLQNFWLVWIKMIKLRIELRSAMNRCRLSVTRTQNGSFFRHSNKEPTLALHEEI